MAEAVHIYTDAWLAAGVVSAEQMSADAAELARGEDPHPEHYRWRRFVKYVHARTSMDAAVARSLYALGEIDPDPALGESIISVIIRREDCPRDLHERALLTTSQHLRRVAQAMLNRSNG